MKVSRTMNKAKNVTEKELEEFFKRGGSIKRIAERKTNSLEVQSIKQLQKRKV